MKLRSRQRRGHKAGDSGGEGDEAAVAAATSTQRQQQQQQLEQLCMDDGLPADFQERGEWDHGDRDSSDAGDVDHSAAEGTSDTYGDE
jgi:hypothetical protein